MNEENNVNQETEEKKEVVETASVAEEKKVESTEKVDKEEEKSKKMDEIFADTGEMVLKDVSKIAGRDLTDAEKKDVMNSLKAFFVLSSLMLKALM